MRNTNLAYLPSARPSTAADLQRTLLDAEASCDASLASASKLIGKSLDAAKEAGIHRAAIQRGLLRLHSTIGHALAAQGELQLFHQQCRTQMKSLNLPELGWGDTGNSPPLPAISDPDSDASASA